MTHISEREFGDRLEPRLEELFGPENVEREHRFPDGMRADFLVIGRLCRWAIELENDAPSVRNAFGQVVDYHRKAPDIRPVIVIPAGHIHPLRYAAYEPFLLIREFDVDVEEFVERPRTAYYTDYLSDDRVA